MSKIRKFCRNKKEVIFFGTNHSDVDTIQINKLKKELFEFKPEIVLVEGGFDKSEFKSEKEAILYGGELGFTAYYSKENGILLEGNDPPEVECIEFLSSIYDKDFAFFYFILRNLDSFLRKKANIHHKEKAETILEQFKKESEWEDYDFSFKNFEKVFEMFFGNKFDFSKTYNNYFSSLSNEKETNEATRKLNKFRDIYMIRKIMEHILVFNKIFIVKGGSHLTDCEALLEKIFK